MKTTEKLLRILCALFALALVCGMAMPAQAAAEGTMMSNAVEAKFGKSYMKTWTKDTDHLNHYITFTVSEPGALHITATKPFDSEGEYGKMLFTLYDADGNPVWGNDAYQAVDDARSEYKLHVGLNPGKYYLTLKPGFMVTSGVIETTYSLSFDATAYCEREPNDDGSLATTVKLGQKYTGWFGSGSSAYEENDYFRIPVTAGYTYRVVWYSYSATARTSTLVYMLMPDGSKENVSYKLSDKVNDEGLNYVDIQASSTGSAYLYMYNYIGAQFEYGFVVRNITCEKKGHTFGNWETVKDATCSASGEQKRECSACGQTEQKTVEPLSHTFGEWSVTKEPTCGENGLRVRSCRLCGQEEKAAVEKLDHTFGIGTWVSETSHQHRCNVCGFEEVVKHTWDTGEMLKEPTCAQPGSKIYTCTECGSTRTLPVGTVSTHVPGPGATKDTPQVCLECGRELAPALGEDISADASDGKDDIITVLIVLVVVMMGICCACLVAVFRKRP